MFVVRILRDDTVLPASQGMSIIAGDADLCPHEEAPSALLYHAGGSVVGRMGANGARRCR